MSDNILKWITAVIFLAGGLFLSCTNREETQIQQDNLVRYVNPFIGTGGMVMYFWEQMSPSD